MTNIILGVLSIILNHLVISTIEQSMPTSPCPALFQYAYDGSEWFGLAELPSSPLGQTIRVNVMLSLRAQLSSKYVGALELYGNRQAAIQSIRQRLPIRYRIRFPLSSPLPKLTEIMYNNQILCRGPPETGSFVTAIRLEHTLYTELANQQYPQPQLPSIDSQEPPTFGPTSPNEVYFPPFQQNQLLPIPSLQSLQELPQRPQYPQLQQPQPQQPQPQQQQTLRPVQTPQQFGNDQFGLQQPDEDTVFKPQASIGLNPDHPVYTQPQVNNEIFYGTPQNSSRRKPDEDICGRAHQRFQIAPLIVGGKDIHRGSWPWLVAVYLNKISGLSFNCGGSLVSSKVVVTAAHCFKTSDKQYEASEVVVFLGRYNIMKWMEEGSMLAEVESIFIHADYMKNDMSFDADLAVVLTKNRITYNEYIRPICLWEGTTNSNDIVGKDGTIVGWGRDGFGNIVTPEPKKIAIPVVSDAQCLRSSDTFRYITSNRTFCAGGRDGRGPCNGDSGSGMTMKNNGKWMLRGVVSAALADPIQSTCNLSEYIVFTDAAKFVTWIKSFMSL